MRMMLNKNVIYCNLVLIYTKQTVFKTLQWSASAMLCLGGRPNPPFITSAQGHSAGNTRLKVSCWYRNSKHWQENQKSVIAPSGAKFLVCPYKDRVRARVQGKKKRGKWKEWWNKVMQVWIKQNTAAEVKPKQTHRSERLVQITWKISNYEDVNVIRTPTLGVLFHGCFHCITDEWGYF